MKLVAFKVVGTGQSVYINPYYVVAVLPGTDDGSTIMLSNGISYPVPESQDIAAEVLMKAGS